MIPCPKLTKTKNSTDMRLTVEVMKDLLTNESVDVFIIASADTDYIPVMKEVYEPVLSELEQHGIVFKEIDRKL
jgi:hypothetical protein